MFILWIANVYIGADEKGNIYFISSKEAKHSRMILKNPKVAFSMSWFKEGNHQNRKGIQGLGECRIAKDQTEIAEGIKVLYKNFPDLSSILNLKWILNNIYGSKIWVLKPNYVKYWDDELYGEDESKEFKFS